MILGNSADLCYFFMLYFAMMAILLQIFSFCRYRKLEVVKTKAKLLTILVLLFSLSGFAQSKAQS
jgi:hypothetical protein